MRTIFFHSNSTLPHYLFHVLPPVSSLSFPCISFKGGRHHGFSLEMCPRSGVPQRHGSLFLFRIRGQASRQKALGDNKLPQNTQGNLRAACLVWSIRPYVSIILRMRRSDVDEPFDGDYMCMLFPSHAPPSRFFQVFLFSRGLFSPLLTSMLDRRLLNPLIFSHTAVAINFSHLVSCKGIYNRARVVDSFYQ